MVSHSFPPSAEVGGLRVSQLCRYLPEFRIEPVVLTVEERFCEIRDLTIPVSAGLKVLRAPMMWTPLDLYKATKKSSRSGAMELDQATGFLRLQARALLEIPDPYWKWYLPAVRTAEEFLSRTRVDAIFSSGPPWTSHLVALRLKRALGLPWIVDFRDPWAGISPAQPKPHWWRDLTERLERRCVRSADLVVCNTDRLRLVFCERYPELPPQKFRTLTNGFDDTPRMETSKDTGTKLLLHLGSLYADRRVEQFLKALANLTRSHRLSPGSFRVVFQGDNEPQYLAQAKELIPDLLNDGPVQFRPRLPWSEARKLLWQADLLLLFQGSHILQIPAKFYEYLQTGIPIFAVCEQGALSDVIESTEAGSWVSPDPQKIEAALVDALRLPHRNSQEVINNFGARYHYRELAKQLAEWICP